MKKAIQLSLKERNRLVFRQRTGKTRKKPINKKITNRNKIKHNPYNPRNTTTIKKITLPKNFDLHENIDETLEKMNQFRRVVDKDRPKLKELDFSQIKYINSSSALMLAAEIDVWNRKSDQQLNSKHSTWDTEIKILLCQMGFFELLGLTRPMEEWESISTTFLKFITGEKVEGEKAKKLRKEIELTIGKEIEGKIHLFSGLSEAFTNTIQHAYDENHLNPYDKWWITAAYKKDDKKLIISMYDRGKSIPTTMKTSKKWLFLDERKYEKHSTLIKIAMNESFLSKKTRSKTGEAHRGKGLKQLLDFIENKGKLTIISKKGYCVFILKNNKLETIQEKELKYPLNGTLIEWEIIYN